MLHSLSVAMSTVPSPGPLMMLLGRLITRCLATGSPYIRVNGVSTLVPVHTAEHSTTQRGSAFLDESFLQLTKQAPHTPTVALL